MTGGLARQAAKGPEFDFVIVGAGSAGCVIAERLSANGRYTVCVIEAGGTDRRFWVQLPIGYGKTFYDPSVNWGYRAEPDPGLAGNADYWPRGKVLGGSGSINAMVWIRGAAADYDGWAADGNPGWGFADCLPHFKAIERAETGDDRWRGKSGAVPIADVSGRLHPLGRRFLEAAAQAGFAQNADFNAETQEGVGVYEINTQRGWRVSAAKAFLHPARKRPNVTVMTRAHACRIVIEAGRATGVEIDQSGRRMIVGARCEVIVASGAVNTPHLLQLSGIGPADHLRAIGRDVLRDLPAVGNYLQDHIGINYIYRARIPSLNEALRPLHGKLLAGLDFFLRGRGPLSLSLNQVGGFVRTRPDLARPNIQLYLQAISTIEAKAGTRPLLTPDPFPGFGLGLSNCLPTSRGSIMARSADPFDAPEIRANALSTDRDIVDYLEGVKLLRTLADQPALKEVIAEELFPGPRVTSDDDLIADARRRSGTVYHPCGTCRMGSDPATSAVDARLRVHGVRGLRVADTSIFPTIISGNTNAAAMMTGSRAAEMILADAG
jgi:choline dehydrogenase